MYSLPDEITAIAYRASNGELAWQRKDVARAIEAIRRRGFAILGWEVWIAVGNGDWHGIIPTVQGRREIRGGETAGCSVGESWQQHCDRTAAQTLQQIEDTPESDCDPEVRNQLRYNLSFVAERRT